jgi:hypothetical protein
MPPWRIPTQIEIIQKYWWLTPFSGRLRFLMKKAGECDGFTNFVGFEPIIGWRARDG